MAAFITVLFDGVAYGSLLFVISVGMSVTMGLMRFINLAHGAFAMFGGYAAYVLIRRTGMSMFTALPIVLIGFAVIGGVLERVLYRWVSRTRPLDQVLFTIGLAFIATAIAHGIWGPSTVRFLLPEVLQGQVHVLGIDLGIYRLFLIGVVIAITVSLHVLVERTRVGAQMRAAGDQAEVGAQRPAAVEQAEAGAGLGIPVDRVFTLSFALGSGLAALGGVIGHDMLGLDPPLTLRYIVYF